MIPEVKTPIVPPHVSEKKRIDWLAYACNKFCTLPWLNLNTNPNGNVKLCCNIQLDHFISHNGVPFNLGYHDIEEVWNNHYMDNVRTLHRKNIGSEDCKDCYKLEKISGHSPRMGQNVMWLGYKEKDEELSKHLQKVSDTTIYNRNAQLPISLELRLGNQCNLQCITCWGMSSSLIQADRLDIIAKGNLKNYDLDWLDSKWREETEVVTRSDLSQWHDTDIFYENIRKMAPNLRRLYTTGGEPTVIKANYKILEMLLEAGNKKCSVEFTSNMTTWNPKFYNALSQFENVEIQMSLDGVDDVAEYIRYGCNFKIVKENVIKAFELASNNPNWRIKSYSVLQALNYKELVPVWDMLSEIAMHYGKHVDWWPITLSGPPHLSLAAIPQLERDQYVTTLLLEAERYSNPNLPFSVSQGTISAYVDSLKNVAYDSDLQTKFEKYQIFLKNHRKKND
jgi:MoaA/NifB/PqqE/SkfB family radical SAM enzyme